MPTLAALRQLVDDRLTAIWPNVVSKQQNYYSNHGEYWQGIVTCDVSALPNNTTAGAAQVVSADYTRHPTDQISSWLDTGIDLDTAPNFAAQIDAYDGPLGQGFFAIVYVKHNGNFYRRGQGFGPGAAPNFDWQQFDPTAGQ